MNHNIDSSQSGAFSHVKGLGKMGTFSHVKGHLIHY